MIKIIAAVRIQKDKIDDFKKQAKILVDGSLAEEGNISYSLNAGKEDPQQFAFIEIWKDQAAIDSHNASPHFTGTIPKIAEMAEGEMKVDLYTEVEL